MKRVMFLLICTLCLTFAGMVQTEAKPTQDKRQVAKMERRLRVRAASGDEQARVELFFMNAKKYSRYRDEAYKYYRIQAQREQATLAEIGKKVAAERAERERLAQLYAESLAEREASSGGQGGENSTSTAFYQLADALQNTANSLQELQNRSKGSSKRQTTTTTRRSTSTVSSYSGGVSTSAASSSSAASRTSKASQSRSRTTSSSVSTSTSKTKEKVLVTCNHCKGDGKLQCSICVGRGTVYSAKAGKQVPCKSCGGDGRFGQCPWCYGSGRIYK